MKQGLHIMLQRLVRSTVSTAPRPNLMLDVPIVCCLEVASKKQRFNALEKRRVSCHDVNKLAVLRTSLAHNNLSVLFNYLSFDFARMFVHQRFERGLAADDRVADFFHAARTKAVGFARKAERRRASLVRFEKWPRRPGGTNGFAFRKTFVDGLKGFPGNTRKVREQLGTLYSRQLALF